MAACRVSCDCLDVPAVVASLHTVPMPGIVTCTTKLLDARCPWVLASQQPGGLQVLCHHRLASISLCIHCTDVGPSDGLAWLRPKATTTPCPTARSDGGLQQTSLGLPLPPTLHTLTPQCCRWQPGHEHGGGGGHARHAYLFRAPQRLFGQRALGPRAQAAALAAVPAPLRQVQPPRQPMPVRAVLHGGQAAVAPHPDLLRPCLQLPAVRLPACPDSWLRPQAGWGAASCRPA